MFQVKFDGKQTAPASPGERGHVYVVDGHSIISEDEILDGVGTEPDRIEDPQRLPLEGRERRRFVDQIRNRLGVDTVQGLSLPRVEGFFAASSRARDFLRSRGYNLGLLHASLAAGHARDGGFLSEATRESLRNMVEEAIRPGIEAAEEHLRTPPRADETWRLLNQEPFQSIRRGLTLQNLEREGILDGGTLRRIRDLFQDLIQRGVGEAPSYANEVLSTGRSPNDFMNAWMALSGLRNAAVRSGLSFDRTEIDRLIAELETRFPLNPARMEVLRALVE